MFDCSVSFSHSFHFIPFHFSSAGWLLLLFLRSHPVSGSGVLTDEAFRWWEHSDGGGVHFSRARFFFLSTITSDSSVLAGCCVRIFDKLMGWRYDGGGHCDGILIFWGILDGVLMVDCCGGFRSAAF